MNTTMRDVHSVARTDQGKVRSRNEDAFLDCPKHGLWVVADGMGGHRGGDIASELIVSSLAALALHEDLQDRVEAVRQCLHRVNRRLGREMTGSADQQSGIMGSTVVALLIEGARAVCLWAGDSRCYLWRQHRLYQLSRDHSLLEQLVHAQHISHEQAAQHPSAHALTRAVGASDSLTLEVIELEVQAGDSFLLCSDGLYQAFAVQALGDALNRTSIDAALEHLFDGALRGAALDNLTAVIIQT